MQVFVDVALTEGGGVAHHIGGELVAVAVPVHRVGFRQLADIGHRATEHGLGRRVVGPAAVEDVAHEVFRSDLPVAVDGGADAAAEELAAALVHVEHHVQVPGHRPEVFLEGRAISGEGGEHQPLVGSDPGFAQAVLRFVEVAFLVALGLVHAHQPATVGAERPAVVVADEAAGIAGLGEADLVAAMRAGIEEDFQRAVLLPHHQHFVLAHGGGQVVAEFRQLRLVGNEQPATGENLLQLLFVNGLVPEHLARQAALLHVADAVKVIQARGRFEGAQRYVFIVIHGSDSHGNAVDIRPGFRLRPGPRRLPARRRRRPRGR